MVPRSAHISTLGAQMLEELLINFFFDAELPLPWGIALAVIIVMCLLWRTKQGKAD